MKNEELKLKLENNNNNKKILMKIMKLIIKLFKIQIYKKKKNYNIRLIIRRRK